MGLNSNQPLYGLNKYDYKYYPLACYQKILIKTVIVFRDMFLVDNVLQNEANVLLIDQIYFARTASPPGRHSYYTTIR